MKIRCTTNSIRLRVRKSDLETLQEKGIIREKNIFAPGQVLIYTLAIWEGDILHANFNGGELRVEIPKSIAVAWIGSSRVGIESVQHTGGEDLFILIEKDFPCRHTEESDRGNTFYELAPEDPSVC